MGCGSSVSAVVPSSDAITTGNPRSSNATSAAPPPLPSWNSTPDTPISFYDIAKSKNQPNGVVEVPSPTVTLEARLPGPTNDVMGDSSYDVRPNILALSENASNYDKLPGSYVPANRRSVDRQNSSTRQAPLGAAGSGLGGGTAVQRLKGTDWNALLLEALDLPESTDAQALSKYQRLTYLSTHFASVATQYGRVIITELFLSPEVKTIQPEIGLGGIAGGDKFLVNGVLFKLARDVDPREKLRQRRGGGGSSDRYLPKDDERRYLYSGSSRPSEENAAKAAGHELKSAIRYFSVQHDRMDREGPVKETANSARSTRLHVPIQALVDFRGFRLVAMPVLPVDDTTQIYGSSNGGAIVHASDPSFNARMAEIARELHIKPHSVNGVTLHSAGDVEGHLGLDGRKYLLDLARAFPPEAPSETPHLPHRSGAVFYRLLRPEFLRYLRESTEPQHAPLSPDTFSGWGSDNHDVHEAEVESATRVLVQKVIPEFAHWFERWIKSASAKDKRELQLSVELHKRGINIRDAQSEAGVILLVEMVQRTLKNLLREYLRSSMRAQATEYAIKSGVVMVLNDASGERASFRSFWTKDLPLALAERFGDVVLRTLSIDPADQTATSETLPMLFTLIQPYLYSVLVYTLRMVGLEFSPQTVADCDGKIELGFTFAISDLQDGSVRVKHMSVLDYAHGRLLALQARSQGDIRHGTMQINQNSGSKPWLKHARSHSRPILLSATEDSESLASSRLLALANNRFASALVSEPTNLEVMKERALSLALQYAGSDSQARAADRALVEQLRYTLQQPVTPDVYHMLVRPLLSQLLSMWEDRRSHAYMGRGADTSFAFSAICGLSVEELMSLSDSQGLSSCLTATQHFARARMHTGGAADPETLVDVEAIIARVEASAQGSTGAVYVEDVKSSRARFATAYHCRMAAALKFWEALADLPYVSSLRKTHKSITDDEWSDESLRALSAFSQRPVHEFVSGALSQDITRCAAEGTGALRALQRMFFAALLSQQYDVMGVLQEVGVDINRPELLLAATSRGTHPILLDLYISSQESTAHPCWGLILCTLLAFRPELDAPINAQGETILLRAVAEKDGDLVAVLLQAGADVNYRRATGESSLCIAVVQGNMSVVELLLKAGADCETIIPSTGLTPLMLACRSASPAMIALVLPGSGNVINARDRHKRTALVHAIEANVETSAECVRLLLHARRSADVDSPTDDGRTALLLAAQSSPVRESVMLELLQAHPPPDVCATTSDGATALHFVARAGATALVEPLLKLGADLNAKDFAEKTPLMYALEFQRVDTVELLVNYTDKQVDPKKDAELTALATAALAEVQGKDFHTDIAAQNRINPESEDYEFDEAFIRRMQQELKADYEAMTICAGQGSEALTRFFGNRILRRGLPLVFLEDTVDDIPQVAAGRNGHVHILKMLKEEYGIRLDASNRVLDTPAEEAARNGHVDALRFIIRESPPQKLTWALCGAVHKGRYAVAQCLIEEFKVNERQTKIGNTENMSMLHWCVSHSASVHHSGHLDCVKLLVKCGVDPNHRTFKGLTALDMAKERGLTDIVEYLSQYDGRQLKTTRSPLMNQTHVSDALEPRDSQQEAEKAVRIAALAIDRTADISAVNQANCYPLICLDPRSLPTLLPDAAAEQDKGCAAFEPAERLRAYHETCRKLRLADDCISSPLGYLVFIWAAAVGVPSVLKELCHRSNQINLAAAVYDSAQLAKVLALEWKGSRITTALIEAAANGHTEVVQLLCLALERKESGSSSDLLKQALDLPDDNRMTALMHAAQASHLDAVRELLRRGANVHVKNFAGKTALALACEQGHEHTVSALLDAGADANTKDFQNWNALICASRCGHAAVLESLLVRAVFSEADKQEALLRATQQDRQASVSVLLQRGVDPNYADQQGQTPLMFAASNGNPEMVKSLLDRGANIEARDKLFTKSAYMKATEAKSISVIRVLHERGVDVNARERSQRTALLAYVLRQGRDAEAGVMKALLEGKPAVNIQDSLGATSLIYAAEAKNVTAILLLLAAGADPWIQDQDHRIAIQRVQPVWRTDCTRPLLQAMDRIFPCYYPPRSKEALEAENAKQALYPGLDLADIRSLVLANDASSADTDVRPEALYTEFGVQYPWSRIAVESERL